MSELAELPWTELPERPLVLIPVGSTEQDGPHLPLVTDTLIATAVARKLTESLGGYVAPAVSIGASGEHKDFPGVLSVGTDALRLLLVELVRSISPWAGRVVLVNGHGGNVEAVTGAVKQLRDEGHRSLGFPARSREMLMRGARRPPYCFTWPPGLCGRTAHGQATPDRLPS